MYTRPVPIADRDSGAMLRDTLQHSSNRVLTQAGSYKREYPLADMILRLAHAGTAQATQPVLLTWNCAQSVMPEGSSSDTPTHIVESHIWHPDLPPVCLPFPEQHPLRQQQPIRTNAGPASVAAAAGGSAVSGLPAAVIPPIDGALHDGFGSCCPWWRVHSGLPLLRSISAQQRKALIGRWLEPLTDEQRAAHMGG